MDKTIKNILLLFLLGAVTYTFWTVSQEIKDRIIGGQYGRYNSPDNRIK